MARRTAGEGVIYQEKNRGLWIYQVSYKDDAGLRKRKKFAAKTRQEAMDKGKSFLLGRGQIADTGRMNITVGEWVPEWIAHYAKPRVRARTLEKYKSCLENYVLPKFKATRIRDLTSAMLQKHFNSLLVDGRSDKAGPSEPPDAILHNVLMRQSKRGLSCKMQPE